MFVNYFLQLSIIKNEYYIYKYINFINSRKGQKIKYQTHYHHILPKSITFFPQFKNLKENKWNGIHLTAREHFIAHWMLHKAFPGSSQTRAFYLMCNENKKINSKAYAEAKAYHSEKLKEWFTDKEKVSARSKKISQKLLGVAKSPAHIAKLVGHEVTESTREKLRLANIGKTMSLDSRAKLVKSRTGVARGTYKEGTKRNISRSRMSFKIASPFGIFLSFFDLSEKTNIPNGTWCVIFGKNLDKVPRSKLLSKLQIKNPEKLTWRELGFDKLPMD